MVTADEKTRAAELSGKIEARKLQAAVRNIRDKAIHAAVNLGKGDLNLCGSGIASGDRVMTDMVYETTFWLLSECKKLIVAYRSTVYGSGGGEYSTLKITLDGDTVFDQHGSDLNGYRPGAWEAKLDRVQEAADAAEALAVARARDKEITAEEASANAVLHAWGLDEAV